VTAARTVGGTDHWSKMKMYDAMAISLILLFLSGVVLICLVDTAMPFFMSRANVAEIMPYAMKAAKTSILLAAICGVLEMVSPGSVIRATSIDITTAVLFVWSCGLIYLLKYRGRMLQS
jgi:hypothetical protein